jgi:Family of unknown function (DUF5989)
LANTRIEHEATEQDRFRQEAARKRPSFLREVWEALRHRKKWWLAPIVAVLLLIGVLVILSGTAVAPFIYTLF